MKEPSREVLDIPALQAKLADGGKKRLWQSLEELAGTREYQAALEKEFREPSPSENRVGRRDILKLMAASAALTGLTGCTKLPTERIVPYVRAPEEVIPGVPLFYATSMPRGGMAVGLLVESHTGRPTKAEGNPLHPASLGSSDIWGQASVLTLWDPDRSQVILHEGQVSDWPSAQTALSGLRDDMKLSQGAGLRILTGAISSPTLASQMQKLLTQFPKAKWHMHEPCWSQASHDGARVAFGRDLNPVYHFDRAAVMVSLDSDFIYAGPAAIRYAREMANGRDPETAKSRMNRLYVVESTSTLTGAMADHRLPIRSSDIPSFAWALAAGLGLPVQSGASPVPANWLSAVVRDLQQHRGSSVILAGESQPASVHALAYAMNQALGNVGATVSYTEPIEVSPSADSLPELTKEIETGEVEALLILGSNPVFTAPVDLDFARQILKVKTRVHLGLYNDETGAVCNWHIPETHYLEAWSDARAYDGTAGIIQPLIAPLYRGRSIHEILAILTEDSDTTPHDLVRDYWKGQRPSGYDKQFEDFWEKTLHDGIVSGSAFPAVSAPLNLDYGKLSAPTGQSNGIEIVFRPDPVIEDGRWSNNSWLQELPKPLTKLTWDNALMLSPATAWKLGVTSGDIVNLQLGPWGLSGPAWIMPGHANDSATVHLGYGRLQAGRVGTGIGMNGYLLRTSASPQVAQGLQIKKTGEQYLLATTQIHHPINQNGEQVEEESVNAFERDLVRIGTLEDFRKDPAFVEAGRAKNEPLSLYEPYKYEGHAWGMSIDLSRCNGCSACVVACYAENNIAVVGKYEVMAGRDMQWIRVDHYYRGDLENPETYHEPLPCMHCQQAPCELVCPVGATMHSSEGLNEMVYNRCVGTRYCSNNCPYKVRRFNFRLYSDWETPSLFGLRNPDVTVRSRGVMEKCTYCVQRINEVKIKSEVDSHTIRDGEILSACQQACPTRAIVFGDINDRNSLVSKAKSSPRNYSLLAELNTQPRTTYLGKLRNPNPEISQT